MMVIWNNSVFRNNRLLPHVKQNVLFIYITIMWLNEKSVFPVILFLAVVILVVLVFSSNTYVPYSDDDIFHEFSVYEGMYEGFDEGFDEGFEEEFDDEGFEEGFEDEGFVEGEENKDTSAQPSSSNSSSKTVSDTTSVAAPVKTTPSAATTSVQTTPSAATAPESGSAPAPATKSGGTKTEPFGPYQLEYSPLTQSDSDKSALHYNPFKQGYAALNMSDKIDRFGAIVHAPQQGKCVSAELSTAHGPLCLTPELQNVMKTRGGNM